MCVCVLALPKQTQSDPFTLGQMETSSQQPYEGGMISRIRKLSRDMCLVMLIRTYINTEQQKRQVPSGEGFWQM